MPNNKSTLIRLKEKDRELRKAFIVEAARAAFGEKTYDKVNMQEIAKAAGIGKSSIYTYFKSQKELYTHVANQDTWAFVKELKKKLQNGKKDQIKIVTEHFIDYYYKHADQWRMFTHLALHGGVETESLEKFNEASRELMDVLEIVLVRSGCKEDTRAMAHTFFSCLSGILISYRNYPGRSEKDRIVHMKRIGEKVTSLIKNHIHK